MNINTATILNLFSSKINPTVKEKLTSLSVDGKIDINLLVQDKGIQTVLNSLFKDIALGTKTTQNVATLLQNNKQNFSFKNLSEDIKNLIQFIQTDKTTSSKLEAQLTSLKGSLIDIKNIDEKILKTNITNSGVFLESKLAQQTIPVSKNIENLLSLLKGQLDITTSTSIKSDIPKDLQLAIKHTIENILKDIKAIRIEKNPQNQAMQLKKIDFALKGLENKFISIGQQIPLYEKPTMKNLDTLTSQLQTQLPLLQGSVDTGVIKTKLAQIQSNPTLDGNLKLEIKNAVENILQDIKTLTTEQNPQKKLQTLSSLETKITTMQHNFKAIVSKSDIVTLLKDLFLHLKGKVENKNLVEIKQGFNRLQEKLNILPDETIGVKTIKHDITNILTHLKTLNTTKMPQQYQSVLQNIVSNTQELQGKLGTIPQVLFENNISKTENFMNDLKVTAKVIDDFVENSKVPIHKELKTVIDKINTQIDFYQLLSYTTNSTHTYLSFLQDEIEDSDIQFHKNNDESFSCQINLTLKKYGDLKILMILDNKNNINVNIGLEQDKFKTLVQQNLQKLRMGLNNINILVQSLNIFSLNNSQEKSIKNSYGDNGNDFSFGLDIKV